MVVCLPSLVVASVEAQSGGGVVTSGRVVVRGGITIWYGCWHHQRGLTTNRSFCEYLARFFLGFSMVCKENGGCTEDMFVSCARSCRQGPSDEQSEMQHQSAKFRSPRLQVIFSPSSLFGEILF